MDETTEYLNRLQLAARELGNLQTEIRGKGLAAFLISTGPGGATELSESSGKVWVEFWLPDKDEAETDADYPTYEAAVAAVQAWLSA